MSDVQKTLPVNRCVTRSHRNRSCLPVFRYNVCNSENGSVPGTVVWTRTAADISAYKDHVGSTVTGGETIFMCNVWKILSYTIREANIV